MIENSALIELGFYGKLPTYGDFIQKRLPSDFINPWHEWLQTGMLACRERDPEGWLSYYLNCPAWSFVLAAGICGQQAVAGVTIPSVDRVGRYFNFTMASILPADVVPTVFASTRCDWFDGLESLALSVLEEELNQDGIEDSIRKLSAELSWHSGAHFAFNSDVEHTRVLSADGTGVLELIPGMLHKLIVRERDPYGLWWHHGSPQVTAQLLSCANMPTGEIYLGLMMDKDLIMTAEASSQASEVDYLDALLAD